MTVQFSPVQEQEIKRLLNLSCNFYSSMEQIYQKFDQLQLTDNKQIFPLLQRLEELKEKVQSVDNALVKYLGNGVRPPASLTSMVKLRRQKIQLLIGMNQQIMENTQRYQAVIQNELSNLYRNKNALSGYKSAQEKTGRINTSS